MSHEGIRFVPRGQQNQETDASQSLTRVALTPQKVRVLLTEGKGLEIDWSDGHKSLWSFAWLREACPCATCIDERKQQGRQPGEPKPAPVLPIFTPPSRPASAHAVGRYALQFNWLDGHSAGIYSWDYLRRSCQCHECTFTKADMSSGTPN